MKLNKEQLQGIENYLNYKELVQMDLRLEILDHMVESIENAMESGGAFSEAFDLECEKWNQELVPYASAWLGLVFSGPKLMMQKCVRIVKRLYLKTLVLALIISGVLFGLTNVLSLTPKDLRIDHLLGYGLLVLSAILLYIYNKISKNKTKTTHGYFIKINTVGIVLNLFIFNPFINKAFGFSSKDFFSFSHIVVYTLLFTYAVLSVNMYKKHVEIINYKLAV